MEDVVHLERIDLMDDMLAKVNEFRKISNPTIYRPSRSLTQTHSSQYLPRYIALGLYNQDIDVKDSSSATIDRSKLQIKLEMANVFKETVSKSWMEICDSVVENPEAMKRMYDDCHIDDAQAVRNILTLDAVFITCILHSLLSDVHNSKTHSVIHPRFQVIATVVQDRSLLKGNTGILLDILAIFQNQIPFQLIRNVVEMMYQTPPPPVYSNGVASAGAPNPPATSSVEATSMIVLDVEFEAVPITSNGHSKPPKDGASQAAMVLNRMVEVACGLMMYSLPGRSDKPLQSPPLETANYSHLLDCVYRTAVQHNSDSEWDWPEDNDDTHPIATASQLKRAGINIVRGAENIRDIRFKRGTFASGASLIIPQIRITPWTETLLRNLVAYEIKVLRKGDLMCYLSFMDQLIDNEQDVLLLKEKAHSVIELSQISSDSEVANIFNSLLHNSNDVPVSRTWAKLRKDIHQFHSSEKRQLWVEFYEIHFGRPWVTSSVVAAIALLALTFLQTLYSMKAYYDNGGSDNRNVTSTR